MFFFMCFIKLYIFVCSSEHSSRSVVPLKAAVVVTMEELPV